MGKLKLEQMQRIKSSTEESCEIKEMGEQKLKEAQDLIDGAVGWIHDAESWIDDDVESRIEAIDIDDIMALMECGNEYSVEELVEQFGISVDTAKSLLCSHSCIDIANKIAEADYPNVASIFEDMDLHECVESSIGDFSLNKVEEFSNEELEQMVYELKHAFE